MSELIDRLRQVQDRVRDLLKERERSHALQAAQETTLNERHQQIEVLTARVAGLEQENEVLRMARGLSGGEGTTEAKQRIDDLVKEIDRCLELIHA